MNHPLLATCLLVFATSLPALAADEGALPNFDFPVVETTAKPGEKIFAVNQTMFDKLAAKGDSTVIFYLYDLVEAGPKTSKIKVSGKENVTPNSLIIPIPKGATAKVGDLLLASWAYSMKRAIVVEAADPKQPTVVFIDLDYDNPAKSKEGVPVAQQEEKLKPDTFVVLSKPFDAGSTVACKDGKDHRVGHVIRIVGDKLLGLMHAGKLKVYPKADCAALDPKPSVKTGDKVFSYWVGALKPSTVVKVDARIGRVWVTEEMGKKAEKAIAFGHVAAKLP